MNVEDKPENKFDSLLGNLSISKKFAVRSSHNIVYICEELQTYEEFETCGEFLKNLLKTCEEI